MALEEAATLDEIEIGGTLRVELSEPVCLVRLSEDDVRAVHDTCSHQGQPLSEGMVDGTTIVCAAHAATFDLDTGESSGILDVPAVPVYPCSVEDGAVLDDLERPLNDAQPATPA